MKKFPSIHIEVKTKGQCTIFQLNLFKIKGLSLIMSNVIIFYVKIGFSFRNNESLKTIFLTSAGQNKASWQPYIRALNHF